MRTRGRKFNARIGGPATIKYSVLCCGRPQDVSPPSRSRMRHAIACVSAMRQFKRFCPNFHTCTLKQLTPPKSSLIKFSGRRTMRSWSLLAVVGVLDFALPAQAQITDGYVIEDSYGNTAAGLNALVTEDGT